MVALIALREVDLDLFAALILGIVEGLTEFIPVSSTGHLIITGKLLRFESDAAGTFEIFIQLGAILAVVFLYWKRFAALFDFSEKITGSGFCGAPGMLKLALGCAPAFVFGALFHKTIKHYLFGPGTVAAALIFGGVAMMLIEWRRQKANVVPFEQISCRQAFLIGLFQCLALWPGISRSGATIIGGLILGLERRAAAEFSFILAVPVMFAAVGYDLLQSASLVQSADIPAFAVGFVVSLVTAAAAVRFFIAALGHVTLVPFGIYRIIAGIVVLKLL
ncbi:MAG TPA: undecaprenyl-diphosphate phosphatase [Oligoflexia bacterium]|nr:undecaprenyl-diphosphate phosphatase [Oligoflexia bacterium]